MLLLRRVVSAVGPRPTRIFLPTSFTSAAATTRRFVNFKAPGFDKADSNSSTDAEALPSTLWQPWQLSDLGLELKLYQQYGPNYIDHVNAKQRKSIRRSMEARKRLEKIVKAEVGDESSNAWYEVLQEANMRHRRNTAFLLEEFKRRERELGPVIDGQMTPEQRQLAEERRGYTRDVNREKNLEVRRQVVAERRKHLEGEGTTRIPVG